MEIPTGKAEREAFLHDLARRAGNGDAEACFQVGAYNITRATEAHYAAADRAFERAIQAGGSSWAWLAVDEYMYADIVDGFGRWMTRGIELDFPLPSAPGITVAPDAFEPVGCGGITWAGAHLQIATDQAPEVEAALTNAADRLLRVDERGREWPTDESLTKAFMETPPDRDGDSLYSASYVSPPRAHHMGPWITLDTDSQMWGPMARTILRVLIEELIAAGVTKARILSGHALAIGAARWALQDPQLKS
jgi:hypothetical protein